MGKMLIEKTANAKVKLLLGIYTNRETNVYILQ